MQIISRMFKHCFILVILLLVSAQASFAQTTYTITTIAGNGSEGTHHNTGDGGPATLAAIHRPNDVVMDKQGNLYISEEGGRIRKVDISGTITTIAGDGSPESSGDGGLAINARIYTPQSLALDSQGNIYFMELFRVRKIDIVTGIISTIAGDGNSGLSGDGGPATSARISASFGVAIDSKDNIYIAEGSGHKIRKIDAITGIITTIAGNGGKGFSGDGGPAISAKLDVPTGLAFDAEDNLYIASQGNDRIRKITASDGIITTITGGVSGFSGDGGPAVSGRLHNPRGVKLDKNGNIYISDLSNHRIRKINAITGIITTIAGSTRGYFGEGVESLSGQLDSPSNTYIDDSGNVYVADTDNHRIRKLTPYTPVNTDYIISTVAGNGTAGFSGDNMAAISASLNSPYSVDLDDQGNLYILDSDNHRVRKMDRTTGIITTIAGNGVAGYSGDGGLATSASLDTPVDMALDEDGNIYISDRRNHRIRKVDAITGIITTVVGMGAAGFSGDGGPATFSQLRYPFGISLDANGDLYIADLGNQRVRKMNISTGIITTIAGTGTGGFSGDGGPATSAQFYNPFDIAIDKQFNVYVADLVNRRIRKIDATTNIISTFAGNGTVGYSGDGGLAIDAQINEPRRIALDHQGGLYIVDIGEHRIRKIDLTSSIITTIAGTGEAGFSGDGNIATQAKLNFPDAIAFDGSSNIYVADLTNHRIRKLTPYTPQNTDYTISTLAGTGTPGYNGDNILATSAQLQGVYDIAIGPNGNFYLADYLNNRIRKVDATTNIITTIAGNGIGGYAGDGGPATSAQLNRPYAIAVDSQGNVYFVDVSNHVIRKIEASTGIISTIAGTGSLGYDSDNILATSASLNLPSDIIFDQDGNILIADRDNNRVRKIDANTGIITTIAGTGMTVFSGDGGLATSANIHNPSGLALDKDGNLYISTADNRIRKVDLNTGIITTIAGTGISSFSEEGGLAIEANFSTPWGIVVDSNGNLFVADRSNYRIRKIDIINGRINTIAGNGIAGFSGDGGIATEAQLNLPQGITIDNQGNIYFAESSNDVIRKLVPNQPPPPPPSPNKYQLSNTVINCRDTTFCVWLQAKSSVSNGIIGMDYCLEYDENVIEPTGNVTLGEVVNSNGNSFGAYKINSNVPGRLNTSIFYQNAPTGTQFSGTGNVICIEFRLKPGATNGQTVLRACEISEAYTLFEKSEEADSSIVTITEEIYKLKGRVVYWNQANETQPLRYDASNPGSNLITSIFGNSSNCNSISSDSVQTDLNGYFTYDTRNGSHLSIKRDIPANSPDLMQVINGMDCYYAALITTFDTQDSSGNWIPQAPQILAADVNMNGRVRANDITLMQQRITLQIPEYPQTWNYDTLTGQPLPTSPPSLDWRFYDVHTTPSNADFSPASNYPVFPSTPTDGGFWRDRVPALAQCVPTEAGTICDTDSTKNLYYGVLLGDVDGNWRSDISSQLRITGIKEGEVFIDLFNAEKTGENTYKIPIHYQLDKTVNALDLSFDYESGHMQIKSITRATEGETADFQMSWNNYQNKQVLLTSYSIKGTNTQASIYYLEVEVSNGQKLSKELFDNFKGYLNGRVSNTQVVKTASEFNEIKGLGTVGVYPNPVSDEITVSYSNIGQGTPKLSLHDALGKTVMIQPMITESGKIKFKVSHLANGVYLLNVMGSDGVKTATKRIVVKH